MTTTLLSFRPGEGDLVVDLPALMEQRGLVLGTSGAGKTHLLMALLQQTYGAVQHMVVDREGDFVGLREKYPYLLVGAEGDVPASLDTDVPALVQRILATKVSTIFDLSELVPDEQQEYVRRVADTMAHLPRSSGLWTPVILVIDELREFAPETGKGSSVATAAISAFASLGRKRGFCLLAATGSLAEVSKSAVRLLENRIILRTGPEDLERVSKMLRLGRAGEELLGALPRGEGYAYGPAISAGPVRVTLPSDLAVLPPRRGELRPPPAAAPAEIRALLAQFRDLPGATETEAGVPGSNLGRAELQRAVDAATAAVRAELAQLQATHHQVLERLRAVTEHARAIVQLAGVPVGEGQQETPPSADGEKPPPAGRPRRGAAGEAGKGVLASPPDSRAAAVLTSDLSRPQQQIMEACAFLHALGVVEPSLVQVALVRGVSHTTGTFKQDVRELVASGRLLRHAGSRLEVTLEGWRYVEYQPAPRTAGEVLDRWCSRLTAPRAALLRAIVAAGKAGITREAVAAQLGKSHTTGTFKDDLRKLRGYGLVLWLGGGRVVASDLILLLQRAV